MNVFVTGAGYIGLSVGAVLANCHDITILDIDNEKASAPMSGNCPIHEADLLEILPDLIASGQFQAIGLELSTTIWFLRAVSH